MPIRWENNSTASYQIDTSGQAVINEQLVKSSDILIAIFGNRIDTKMNSGKSGIVEEINVFIEEHKNGAGIFFVDSKNIPVNMAEERKMVELYKIHLSDKDYGLYHTYLYNNIVRFLNKEVDTLLDSENGNINNENSIQSIDIFDEIEFDNDEQLLIIFIVEFTTRDLGASWKEEETIEKIKKWESKNVLSPFLSENYAETLEKISDRGYFKLVELTSYDNSKLYRVKQEYYKEFKKIVRGNEQNIEKIKGFFKQIDAAQYSDNELQF